MKDILYNISLHEISEILPMAIWIVGFSLWNFILVKLVRGSVHRDLLHHPKLVSEIVRFNLRNRDEEIKRLKHEIKLLRSTREKLILAIQNMASGLDENDFGDEFHDEIKKKRKNA